MRYLRNVEDENGDLVELVYYCSELCYAGETDPSIAALSGGAWPCLDSELDAAEYCHGCGSVLGAEYEALGVDHEGLVLFDAQPAAFDAKEIVPLVPRQLVPITGSVLRWAMEESGIDAAEMADRLGVDTADVEDLATGDLVPTKTQFNRIVDILQRPSAIFFLSKPPKAAGLPTSLLCAPGLGSHALQRSEVRQIRWARRVQQLVSMLEREGEADAAER